LAYGDTTSNQTIDGKDDLDRHNDTYETLQYMFRGDIDHNKEAHNIYKILAGILFFGQLQFTMNKNDEMEIGEHELTALSKLLELSSQDLQDVLTTRTISAAGATISVPLTTEQATAACDALAKDIYFRLFNWVVELMNRSTAIALNSASVQQGSIALLDIFGFESFQNNFLEQLCINYANEKLQQQFASDLIKSVQREYEEEGISWTPIFYADNFNILQLIEGRGGIIDQLNEECIMPGGSDSSFLNKLTKIFQARETTQPTKKHPTSSLSHVRDCFYIHHYAGSVLYSVSGFIAKNKDTVLANAANLMLSSSSVILSELFPKSIASNNAQNGTMSRSKHSVDKYFGKSVGNRNSTQKQSTITTQFKGQLCELMNEISSTRVQYIRCIKPNSNGSSVEFNLQMITEQLRSGGMVEAAKVSRQTYPCKMKISDCWTVNKCLVPLELISPHENTASCCTTMLSALLKQRIIEIYDADGQASQRLSYQVGKSFVYFSREAMDELQLLKQSWIIAKAIVLQTFARKIARMRHYHAQKRSIIVLQTNWRMRKERANFLQEKFSAVLLQSIFRSFVAQRIFQNLVVSVLRIQRTTRYYQRGRRIFESASKIQSWMRQRNKERLRAQYNKLCSSKNDLNQSAKAIQTWFKNNIHSRTSKLELGNAANGIFIARGIDVTKHINEHEKEDLPDELNATKVLAYVQSANLAAPNFITISSIEDCPPTIGCLESPPTVCELNSETLNMHRYSSIEAKDVSLALSDLATKFQQLRTELSACKISIVQLRIELQEMGHQQIACKVGLPARVWMKRENEALVNIELAYIDLVDSVDHIFILCHSRNSLVMFLAYLLIGVLVLRWYTDD
jgi:myosin heavy subunit